MLSSNSVQNKTAKVVALTLSLTAVVNSFSSVLAQPDSFRRSTRYPATNQLDVSPSQNQFSVIRGNRNYLRSQSSRRNRWNNYFANLPVGTVIPTSYPEAEKILVTKDETLPLTLEVSVDVTDRAGNIIIPRGSQIIGEIRPANGGSRFVGDTLVLTNGNEYFIDADSRVISRTINVEDGRNTDAIWQGALAGTAAATILAGVTGDKAIATEEVLGGAGFGALAGLLLGGTKTKELIEINSERDLDLTLTSNLSF